MDSLFIVGLSLIFIGIILIILSIIFQSKKLAKSESGFVVIVWPFFIIGGNEKIVPILIILIIILVIIFCFSFLKLSNYR